MNQTSTVILIKFAIVQIKMDLFNRGSTSEASCQFFKPAKKQTDDEQTRAENLTKIGSPRACVFSIDLQWCWLISLLFGNRQCMLNHIQHALTTADSCFLVAAAVRA